MAWWTKKEPASRDALVAAASAVKASRNSLVGQTVNQENWQDDAWKFYDALGEFRYAVSWKSEMISRIRLRAGKKKLGLDEPEIIDEGPAAELIAELAGGIGGQAEMLGTLATQLGVPGEGWLIGEAGEDGENKWRVYSSEEIQIRNRKYQVIDEEAALAGRGKKWRTISDESLVIRIWRPHKRFHYLADSPARAAISTMRELELVNRKIQANYLSRLASAGVVIFPDEITFPVRPEFQDEPDPFVAEWIETAATAIKRPGTASAVIPIPLRVPGEFVDKVQFLDFSVKEDEKIIEKRESSIRRLATQVDVPAEILLGMGDVNHWTAWQLEESAIKAHISSDVELIVHALTIGYLIPRLKAMGEDPTDWVVWYDASELTIRPDRTDAAFKAYDRLELNGAALRRETGLDESDAPSTDELRGMVLKKLAQNPQIGLIALAELISDPNLLGLMPQKESSPEEPEEPEEDEDINDRQEPDTQEDQPDNSRELINQMSNIPHRFRIGVGEWTLYHPDICKDHLMNCPVAEASRYLKTYPGKSGTYVCWLSSTGELSIGTEVFDQSSYLKGHTRKVKTNGSSKRLASKATR